MERQTFQPGSSRENLPLFFLELDLWDWTSRFPSNASESSVRCRAITFRRIRTFPNVMSIHSMTMAIYQIYFHATLFPLVLTILERLKAWWFKARNMFSPDWVFSRVRGGKPSSGALLPLFSREKRKKATANRRAKRRSDNSMRNSPKLHHGR